MKNKIILFIAIMSCFLVVGALFASATDAYEGKWFAEKEPVTDFAYSMAVIGDTQIVSQDAPENMAKIYEYILNNVDSKNIKFVMGLGDITDDSRESEWENDVAQIKRMDGIVPYSLVKGNHDLPQDFNKYIYYEDYKDIIAGAYEAGSMLNTYHTFTVGDIQYMVMCLDFGAKDDVIEWANEVIEAHPYHNVIITTHAYMFRDGNLLNSTHGDAPSNWNTGDEAYNDGDEMWEKLIKKHKNIVLVLSGHIDSETIVMRQDEGDNGNTVTQMLINPQYVDRDYISEGCVGMVAMFYFSEDGKTVQVEYYSTIQEQYLREDNQFTFELDVVEAVEPSVTSLGISMDGYAVRLEDYNGLRGFFSFDMNYSDKLEDELDYKLVEFGAIALPEEAYIANGKKAVIDPDTLELTTKGHKAAIWSGGKYVNRILEEKDGIVSYCLAVVNFESQIKENLYFCAYSVYKDPNGETVIDYADYEDFSHRLINLYQTTLDMYINGAINSSNTDDAAVWNTLLTGAVTLTESDYTAGESGTKKEDGSYYTGDFLFAEIPVIIQQKISSDINVTLVEDIKNDSWIAIYRGEGEIVQTYNNGRLGQLISEIKAGTVSPSPMLTPDSEKKINTVIYDHGITKIGTYALYHQEGVNTVVYPKGVSFGDTAFSYAYNLNTVYEAKATGYKQENKIGLLDFSTVSSVNTAFFFRNVRAGVKLHLPATLEGATIGTQMFYDDWARKRTFLTKVWCGDTAEPANGVIDLTGANITSIGDKAFTCFSSLKTLILPDSCLSIGESAFTPYTDCTSITTVKQATKNDTILAYCTTNNITYTNLDGTVTYYTATVAE